MTSIKFNVYIAIFAISTFFFIIMQLGCDDVMLDCTASGTSSIYKSC